MLSDVDLYRTWKSITVFSILQIFCKNEGRIEAKAKGIKHGSNSLTIAKIYLTSFASHKAGVLTP